MTGYPNEDEGPDEVNWDEVYMSEEKPEHTPLLPCPFCGGEATFNGLPKAVLGQIRCTGEECFGPRTTALTKQDSIVQWNTRAGHIPAVPDLTSTQKLAIANEFDGMAKAHKAMGESEEATKYRLAAAYFRTSAAQS